MLALERDRPGDYSHLIGHLEARKPFQFSSATLYNLVAATSAPELDEWAEA